MKLKWLVPLMMLSFGLPILIAHGQEEGSKAASKKGEPIVAEAADTTDEAVVKGDETSKIEEAIASYIAAFNDRNAKKLASHWSPDGVYTSRSSGEQVVGREAMVAEFSALFEAESVPKLAVETESIEFISPNVALERGVSIVTHSEDDVVESTYSVVYVKRDGVWLIDRVTEDVLTVVESNYEQLKDLEWLVGEWRKEGDGFRIEVSCRWTTNKNFLSRIYKVYNEGELESSGLQVIGWDANNKGIQSWLFASDGGTVRGKWSHRDDRWVVQSVASLAGGGLGSFTSIFRPQEDGNYRWEKINRVADGKILPNIEETLVERK